MRLRLFLSLAAVMLVAVCNDAPGQQVWGGGQCQPGQGCPVTYPAGMYVTPSMYYNGQPVYIQPAQVVEQQPVTPVAAEAPVAEAKAKEAPKEKTAKAEALRRKPKDHGLPTGVVPQHLRSNRYHINGIEVPKRKAYEAVGAAFEDESGKRRITIIGSEAERKQALAALPADVQDWAVVTCFDPSDWYVSDAGFDSSGHPTVYGQAPDGTVLHRQSGIAGLQTAAMKLNPNYDPAKDPNLNAPPADSGTASSLFSTTALLPFAAGGIFSLVLRFGLPILLAWLQTKGAAGGITAAELAALIAQMQANNAAKPVAPADPRLTEKPPA